MDQNETMRAANITTTTIQYYQFGPPVSLSGSVAVVSAMLDDDNGVEDSGSVYIFDENSGTGNWDLVTKLTAGDGTVGSAFGSGVSVSDTTLAVGARDQNNGSGASGPVYIYEKNGSSWAFVTKITSSDIAPGDRFGNEVALKVLPLPDLTFWR
jgi:hypothetical protein